MFELIKKSDVHRYRDGSDDEREGRGTGRRFHQERESLGTGGTEARRRADEKSEESQAEIKKQLDEIVRSTLEKMDVARKGQIDELREEIMQAAGGRRKTAERLRRRSVLRPES